MSTKERSSNIELFRIITMLIIVAHHYVVNSGMLNELKQISELDASSVFLLLFGWGGKTGINCFVLITGYFMCKSQITLKKFLKLFLEMKFYSIIIWFLFLVTGYADFELKSFIKMLLPVASVSTGFGSTYIVFFLFIPFVNILIKAMNRKQHLLLILLSVTIYTILPNLTITVRFNYVTWFIVLYLIASYIRLYPDNWLNKAKFGGVTLITLLLSWLSVIVMMMLRIKFGMSVSQYFFVADSNKILALVTAVSAFMFFKNLDIPKSKFINTVAASTFGVLLIHANSDTMRRWLWRDTLNNVGMMNSPYLYIHAIASVLGVYIVCTLIDMMRIKFIEKPFFKLYDKKEPAVKNYIKKMKDG